jgi:Leucine-rich repeat (LRR) protein
LDLSYNALTSASLQQDVLSSLILADDSKPRKGLRHLRLRGNRIDELDAFQGIADLFKGNRSVPDWKLEELDLRDNEISKLPAELGLLPLDVFLVDGNLFRIPQRRVWEREGTRGLLSWLRGRLE